MGIWDSIKGANDWWNKTDEWVVDNVFRPVFTPYKIESPSDKANREQREMNKQQTNSAGPMGPQAQYGRTGPMGPMGPSSIPQGVEEQGPSYDDVLAAVQAMLNPGDSESGSGSGSGYNVQALVNQINDSFNRQQQALDASKGVGASNIQNAYNQFASNIGRNYADYTGASQQAQAAMAQRVAQQIAEAQARQGELQRSAQSMGMDIGALTQQQAGNLAALQTSAGFQQDLGQRLAQVVANNQRSLEGSGELVRQGAMGNLENNYQALLGALQAAREQQIMSAQSAGYGGGGGGGGGGSATKPRTAKDLYDEFSYVDKLVQMLMGEEDEGGDFAGVSTDKLMDVYAANVNGDETQQAVAAQILPYLARKNK